MSRPLNLSGKRVFRLLVLHSAGSNKHGQMLWNCQCDCGKTTVVSRPNLKQGSVQSCGCVKSTRDGLSNSPTGVSWRNMMTRCFDSKTNQYVGYGGRGITVCKGLRDGGPTYLIGLIGIRPKGKTIDRPDNESNYSCGKCSECSEKEWVMNLRWATKTEQNRNQRDLHYLTINGRTQCASAWAEESGINLRTILFRCGMGWTGERLLSPVRKKRND